MFLLVTGTTGADTAPARVLILAIAISVVFAVLLAALLAADLGAPLRAIARSVDQVSAGDDPGRLELPGDDEFSRLAESHNRLARDLGRRNRELRQIVVALEATSVTDRPDAVLRRAAEQARVAFGMIDCQLLLVDPREIPTEEIVPGDPVPIRADLIASGEQLGVAVGHLPATRRWERADQDLFELFAIEVSAAIRNAQLYQRVEDQNRRLVELDEAKDDFLRGVSHNLQTPLASIRGYAQQLATDSPDRRLGHHHRAGRPAVADGPPAADGEPDRVRRAPAPGRGRVAGRARAPHVGGAGRRPTCRSRSRTGPPAGWRSPTATSSTRCCGRCSTTRWSTAVAPRST